MTFLQLEQRKNLVTTTYKKFKVDAKENLDDGFNGGVYGATDTTSGGVSPTEANISLQLSSGCAYVQGYRTERLSTTYKDVEKPRTFTTELNKTLTSDFGNYVFMTNLYEAPRLYETIEFYDEATVTPGTAAGQPIGKARVTNLLTKKVHQILPMLIHYIVQI